MKKGLLVAFTVILCACSAQANLLANSGFEDGVAPWTFERAFATNWAARSGDWGVSLWGWDPSTSGRVYQNVTNLGAGTYTFTIYAQAEANFNPSLVQMRLRGLEADGLTVSETDATNNWTTLAKGDGKWHQLFVTATFTNPNTAVIQPAVFAVWDGSDIGQEGFRLDDAALYVGSYTGAPFANGGFEEPGPETWKGTIWEVQPEDHWSLRSGWIRRSGNQSLALEGWPYDPTPPTGLLNRASQPITTLSTGDYTFSLWMLREENHKLNSAALRIEFYDVTCSNKAQPDAVANLSVPNDGAWHEYYVVGTLTNPAVYEVRPVIEMGWDRVTNADLQTAFIDDARFFSGAHDGVSVRTDWAYHSREGYDPMLRDVPGTGGFGPFLQTDYKTRTNTFQMLTDVGELAKYEGEHASVWLRTSWLRPGTADDWVETHSPMTLAGAAEIAAAEPFHGLPVAGTKTVSVWRCKLAQPRSVGGEFYTNRVRIYYAPYIKPTNALFDTGSQYLLRTNGSGTNNLGQLYGPSPIERDYYFDNYKPPAWGVFTNGGFENPEGVESLDDSGWFGSVSGLGRVDWVARTGDRALAFFSWNPGSAWAFQDVATTGGLFSFSSGVRVEPGVTNLADLSLRMEWFTDDDVLVQTDERSLLHIPRTALWYADAVVGACHAPDLAYVRLSMRGEYGPTSLGGASTAFDDAQFIEVATELRNGGFEDELDGSGWISSGYPGRTNWAARSGDWGVYFPTWDAGEAAIFQDMATTGGLYEFSLHMQVQEGAQPIQLEMKMEWYDRNGVMVQENIQDLLAMNVPKSSNVWNRFGVLGACHSNDLSHVRFIVRSEFEDGTEPFNDAIKMDDVTVTPVRTVLENEGFEIGYFSDIREWYGIPQYLVDIYDFANRSGSNGVAFHGWESGFPSYQAELVQPVAAQTGAYTFSVWIRREMNFSLSGAQLRLEWYGGDYPNKVQADTVLSISPPNDGEWRSYAVTGTCLNAAVRFVRPVVFAQWTTGVADPRSYMIDDAMLTYTNIASDETDGIPNWWWEKYGVAPVDRVAANYPPGHPSTYLENYYADTDPTDPDSYFRGVGRMGLWGLGTEGSTNSRIYYITYKTNLMNAGDWLPYGVERQGNPDGSGLDLIVTNDARQRFYRIGVRP